MKIGLLNPTVLLRRPIVEIAKNLKQRGHEVTIVTPVDRRRPWVSGHFEDGQVSRLELPCREIRSILWNIPTPSACVMLWRAMKHYDVLHIWAPYYILAVLPLLYSFFQRSRLKIVLTFDTFPGYSFTFDSPIDFFMRCYHQTVGWFLFRRADAITVYGNQLLPFARRLHFAEQKIHVLPTGVTLPKHFEFRKREDRINLLFVGLMNRRKGVGILLSALAKLQNMHVAFHAVLIGDGPQREQYIAEASRCSLSASVDFIGRTSSVKEYFPKADMLILPSYGEGLPGVVMEAMALGTPVIASNIPCLPDLIPNASFGQLIPVGNVDALVQAILAYSTNEQYQKTVAENARKRIASFDWSLVTSRYETLYENLV